MHSRFHLSVACAQCTKSARRQRRISSEQGVSSCKMWGIMAVSDDEARRGKSTMNSFCYNGQTIRRHPWLNTRYCRHEAVSDYKQLLGLLRCRAFRVAFPFQFPDTLRVSGWRSGSRVKTAINIFHLHSESSQKLWSVSWNLNWCKPNVSVKKIKLYSIIFLSLKGIAAGKKIFPYIVKIFHPSLGKYFSKQPIFK